MPRPYSHKGLMPRPYSHKGLMPRPYSHKVSCPDYDHTLTRVTCPHPPFKRVSCPDHKGQVGHATISPPLLQATPEALASAVLAEVLGQLVEYMRNRGISPLNVQQL